MRHVTGLAMGAVGMFGAWQLLSQLSPDAVGMIVGLLFGTLAGVPATLLLLYGAQRERPHTVGTAAPARIIYIERPAIEAGATAITRNTERRITCDRQEI